MNKIKYSADLIKLMTFFESMTGAKVRDCISNEKLLFIVEESEMGKAIGRNGANIKRMESAIKRKIKLVEFSNDVLRFVGNMIYPAEVLDIKSEEGVITIQGKNTSAKAMLIGRERQNLNHLADIVKRYFDIKEIKVV
ncbi:NusA-like transcription termination signal-binding factor [Candidatus Woesearchaeota archaeon]|nr:NusA-like transcription termination signal-binding factor [Candidatus Woesearchaeota archaeon]